MPPRVTSAAARAARSRRPASGSAGGPRRACLMRSGMGLRSCSLTITAPTPGPMIPRRSSRSTRRSIVSSTSTSAETARRQEPWPSRSFGSARPCRSVTISSPSCSSRTGATPKRRRSRQSQWRHGRRLAPHRLAAQRRHRRWRHHEQFLRREFWLSRNQELHRSYRSCPGIPGGHQQRKRRVRP